MATLKQGVALSLFIALFILLILFAMKFPLEEVLSKYPFVRRYPWYTPWRGAVVSLLIWLVIMTLRSFDVKYTKYMVWISALTFMGFHYYILINYIGFKNINIKPLFLELTIKNHNSLYLDLGQIVLLFTIADSVNWKKLLKKETIRQKVEGQG